MAFEPNEFYYDEQIKKFVLQFMAIFTGMQVRVGRLRTGATIDVSDPTCEDPNATSPQEEYKESRLISVPVHYGDKDRVVAALLADNTQTKPIRLPAMSVVIKGIALGKDRFHGTGIERRNAYTPVGGLVPDDTKVVHQRMPVPYDLTMELAIYVSNTEQHFQLLEQIFLLFDPKLNIQATDGVFDWTRLTQVTLDDIGMNNNYPIGTDRRIIQSELTFTMPVWISAPADVRKNIIEKIYLRIGAVSNAAATNFDIIAELDGQNLDYELVNSSDDMNFQ